MYRIAGTGARVIGAALMLVLVAQFVQPAGRTLAATNTTLTLSKTVNGSACPASQGCTAVAGQILTYRLSFANTGAVMATGVTITDTLSPGQMLVGASMTCAQAAGMGGTTVVTCGGTGFSIPAMGMPGSTGTLVIQTRLMGTTTEVTDTGSISAANVSTLTSNTTHVFLVATSPCTVSCNPCMTGCNPCSVSCTPCVTGCNLCGSLTCGVFGVPVVCGVVTKFIAATAFIMGTMILDGAHTFSIAVGTVFTVHIVLRQRFCFVFNSSGFITGSLAAIPTGLVSPGGGHRTFMYVV